MKCAEFLARFSEYHDTDPALEGRAAFEEHLARCRSCARYLAVFCRGVELLRKLPPSRPREDFRERLRYSIYRFEDEERRKRHALGASPMMLLVAAWTVLAIVLGAQLVWDFDPSVELAPIVVQGPAEDGDPEPSLRISVVGSGTPRAEPASWLESLDLWAGSNVLLYEHSRLYQRNREPELVRTGLR